MTRLTIAKLVIAALGLLVFLLGIKLEVEMMRLIGIGVMAVAFVLRFVRRPPPTAS